MPTAAGISITAESAVRVPAVKRCRDLLSTSVASLLPPGSIEHWNDWTTPFEGVRQLVVDMLLQDMGGLAWVNRVDGKVAEIIRFQPGTIVATRADTGEPSYKIRDRVLDRRDIIHLPNIDDRSPVTLAREAIGLALIMERHGARLFGNGARPSGVLSLKNSVTPEAVAKIREAWLFAHGGDKSGGTAIVGNDATYSSLTFNSVDSQYIELRQYQLAEISRAFYGVPLPMLSDLSRATWSNGEQQGKEFLTYTLEPLLQATEGAFARVGLVVKFDRDDLTRADIGARATAYSQLISSRVLNPNEARSWEGLPPYSGGEAFSNPHITTTAPRDGSAGN